VIDLAEGRPALTHWWVEARVHGPHGDARTRVLLKPVTGRSHQLRLHLRHIGHPILGDDLDAPAAVRALADRLLLHALSLTITHPQTASRMTFESACPF
jgi:tRNA pseudouridine32 synthase/23S rRNA pseudouridine746 synthase